MNIFCNSEGVIFHIDKERIFQGSAGVNKIYFVGQFPTSAQVLMSYELPNGTLTTPKMLTFVSELQEVETENGGRFGVWEGCIGATPRIEDGAFVKDDKGNIVYDLDYTITEHYGTATMQFFVHHACNGARLAGDDVGVNLQGGVLATASVNFTIEKGTPAVLPYSLDEVGDVEEILNQILALLANTQSLYGNANDMIVALQEKNAAQDADIATERTDRQAMDSAISQAANEARSRAEIAVASAVNANAQVQKLDDKLNEEISTTDSEIRQIQIDLATVKGIEGDFRKLDGKVRYYKASTISVSVDPSTYEATITLHADGGTPISKATIDLPTEEIVIAGYYDETHRYIVLTLRNGTKIEVPVGDLVDGLISTTQKGAPNGVAPLDGNGKIPKQYLPDDIGGADLSGIETALDGILAIQTSLIGGGV